VKLLLVEAGSRTVGAVWDDADLRLSSSALYPESRAALASARRSRRIDGVQQRAAVAVLDALWPELGVLELTEPLARRAGELAEAHALRGYDAIHLASAAAVLDRGSVMVVADHRLARAAAAIGLEALVPRED